MTAPTLDDLKQAVAQFQATERHPHQPPLAVSGLYDLDPAAPVRPDTAATWPAPWPHSGEPGVYAVLTPELVVRYIGKADRLDKRLGEHFRGRTSEPPELRPRVFNADDWPESLRRYVVVIPVGKAHETLSLEMYLIRQIQPPQNVTGKGQAHDRR